MLSPSLSQKAKSCTYKYSSEAKIIGGEEIDVTASVDILCESGQHCCSLGT